MQLLAALVLLAVGVVTCARPHRSLVVIAAALPLERLLPESFVRVLPMFGSPLAALSAIAAAGALIGLLARKCLRIDVIVRDRVLVVAALFIVWILISHPEAAWSGAAGRYWAFTFVQLWALLVIASIALETEEKHIEVITVFVAACLISAHVAIQAGVIADVRELGVRSAGYGLGLNASARYFALSVGLLLYLSQRAERLPIKLLALAGAIYQFLGVVFIQSRSGILISLCAVVLMSTVGAKRKAARIALNATVVLLIAVAVLPDGAVSNVLLWFTPEAVIPREQLQGIDNNIRFHLWQAGWAVWRDSPITGVGIGGFAPAAQDYLDFRTQIEDLPPHNMFVGLLSETGIVGFLLFAVLIGGCMRRAWRAYKRSNPQRPDASAVWLIAVGLLIAGGLLKDETSEKLLWLALGAAASFRPARAAQRVRRVVRLVRRPAPLGRVPAPDTVSMARTIR